jgi:hypothetical protein
MAENKKVIADVAHESGMTLPALNTLVTQALQRAGFEVRAVSFYDVEGAALPEPQTATSVPTPADTDPGANNQSSDDENNETTA